MCTDEPTGRLPSVEDMALVGRSLVKKYDKGSVTTSTVEAYIAVATEKYGLTEEEAGKLAALMKSTE